MQDKYPQHRDYVEKQMEGYSREQQSDVIGRLVNNWPSDDQLKKMVTDKKTEIANQASPEEIDEAFKNFRI